MLPCIAAIELANSTNILQLLCSFVNSVIVVACHLEQKNNNWNLNGTRNLIACRKRAFGICVRSMYIVRCCTKKSVLTTCRYTSQLYKSACGFMSHTLPM